MTSQPPRNMAASVHQRLLNRSRANGEDFQFLLQRYASERFLYRLGQSSHRERYVLKGAMLFALWGGSSYRPTRDLDFTGYGSNETDDVLAALRGICSLPVLDDGLAFDTATLTAEPIRDDSEYQGLRVKFQAKLDSARIPMQIDIGFGNAIVPPATEADYPTLLDSPAPHIRAYPHEAVVAEKLHAMVVLGERNSRYKDFYDLHVLARQFPFDGERLASAVAATFERRRTSIDAALPAALTPRFFADDARSAQWRAYLRRNDLPAAPAGFTAVGELLQSFLGPVWGALAVDRAFADAWAAGGPWTSATFADAIAPGRLATKATGPVRNSEASPGRRRFKPYPAYKDSGVEWLGEIPAHWEVKRLKFEAVLNPRGSELRTLASDTEVSFVPMEAVGEYGGIDLSRTKQLADAGSGYTYFREGDVVVAKITPCFENGKGAHAAGLVNGIAFGTTELHVLRPRQALDARFLFYLTLSSDFRQHGEAEMYGAGGQKRVPESFVENLRHPIPPLVEQRAIAAFLDVETARIDALVAKNERLVELLQENRTALITRAVTKGLDPTVPMKDSGVEWLGEIPARWEVKRLKYLASMNDEALPEDMDENREISYVDIGNVDAAAGIVEKERLTFGNAPSRARRIVRHGDVIVSTVRTYLRAIAPVAHPESNLIVSTGFAVVRPREIETSFAAYGIRAPYFVDRVVANSVGVSYPAINADEIACFHVAYPGADEQRAIADFLDRETAKIDTLIAKAHEAVDRLKELRIALISAAVTGKIDVREGGRMKEEGGRMKDEGGRRKEEGGRRKDEGGRRKDERSCDTDARVCRQVHSTVLRFA